MSGAFADNASVLLLQWTFKCSIFNGTWTFYLTWVKYWVLLSPLVTKHYSLTISLHVISHWNKQTAFPQSPVWVTVAHSSRRGNVSVTPCVCTMEAVVGTLMWHARKKVRTIALIKLLGDEQSSLLFFMCQNSLPSVARGDTFEEVTEVGMAPIESATTFTPTFNAVPTEVVMTSVDGDTTPTLTSNTVPATFPSASTVRPTPPVNPDAVGCSGRPFDAFLQLKNGSIYAFRGKSGNL